MSFVVVVLVDPVLLEKRLEPRGRVRVWWSEWLCREGEEEDVVIEE